MNLQAPPVLVVGMHRSGTSLTASMLQSAGVNIGHNLIGPGNGNQLGHFEDVDLYSLHCDILASQGIHKDGWTTHLSVKVPDPFRVKAKQLYQQKSHADKVWGWKDPRTALFLNFWQAMIPAAKFVFVYRQPYQVVMSLFNRGDVAFVGQPQLAADAWLTYNRAILRFYQQNAASCFLFNVDNFRRSEKLILYQLCEKLSLSLNVSCRSVYQPSELHQLTRLPQNSALFYSAILSGKILQMQSLYQALEKAADLPTLSGRSQEKGPTLVDPLARRCM